MSFQFTKTPADKILLERIAIYISSHFVDDCTAVAEAQPVFLPDQKCCGTFAPEEEIVCSRMSMTLSLEDVLRQEDAGFTETLLKMIDRTGEKDSYIYKKAGLTKQHFSKIRNNPDYKPTKSTAIALALALKLDLEDTKDLIGRAGYALTNSSKFDLIVRYFIEQGIYDVVQINMALYEFDQPLLGS